MLLSVASLSAIYCFRENLSLLNSAEYAKSKIRKTQMQAIQSDKISSCKIESLCGTVFVCSGKEFKFSRSGFPVVGGSGTEILKNKTGRIKKIVVSSVGRVRVE